MSEILIKPIGFVTNDRIEPIDDNWSTVEYFHCAIEGVKLDCLRNHKTVSFCVVGRTEVLPSKFGTIYESAIAFGVIAEVEGEEKRKL